MKKPLNIIMAEDDADDRYLFNSAFTGLHLPDKLTFADDGIILLDVLKQQMFDLIILDINMPRKNGLQCLEVIRSDSNYDWVPVFLYSTTRNEVQIAEAYEKRANLFLRKPDGFDGITELIKKLVSVPPDSFFPQPSRDEFILQY